MTAHASLIGTLLGVVALVGSACGNPTLRLVYNASDSAPQGWYAVVHPDRFRVGGYVVARLPRDMGALAASRGYLPLSVPVLKRIAAAEGQRVCVRNATVFVDDEAVARTLDTDKSNRPMTPWLHCRLLVEGELFLLNASVPDSFDSRYFGPVDVSFVRGQAIPLAAILPP